MTLPHDRKSQSPARVTRRRALALGAAITTAPAWVIAQSDRPVRLIVATSAGSGSDATFRAIQPAMARALGSPVVVENIAGAGGMIALQTVARARPDGHTLCATSNNMVIQPNVVKALYDVTQDFSPVAIIGDIPVTLVVHPGRVPVGNAREFIAFMKAKADSLNYGSAGNGTILHLAVEMFLDQIGVKVRHVPYKGPTPMTTDLLGGQIDFAASALPVVLPHIRSGALRSVGICTPRRIVLAPELPTFVEQGLPDYVVQSWLAVVGPKGLAPEVTRKLHESLTAALNDSAVRTAMDKMGNVILV